MGLECETVYVADDSAVPLGKGKTGRRGVAGTVFVHKCAGAVAKKVRSEGERSDSNSKLRNFTLFPYTA
jgi:dihydroxyacetone kinase